MSESTQHSDMIVGEAVSSGIARGSAYVCTCGQHAAVSRRTITASEVHREMNKLDNALAAAEKDLVNLHREIKQRVGDDAANIFQAHISLLRDPALRNMVQKISLNEKINVEAAIEDAIKSLTSIFAQMETPYFRERADDLQDIKRRLLDFLNLGRSTGSAALSDDSVIVTSELLPSVMAQLDSRKVRGLIVEKGGPTAHTTILARELGIPMLIHVPAATNRIQTGDRLLVDGLGGRVFINPTQPIVHEYDRLEADFEAHRTALEGLVELPTITRDGVPITLCANVSKSADAAAAAKLNADGIGLYRTEFVFFVQDHFPSEDEQYRMYRTSAEHANPRKIVIRLLDIGGDKPLHYFPLPLEANPSLGLRGTRLLLAYPELVRPQLRAILRLSATHPVSILLPMVCGAEDVRAIKKIISAEKAHLASEGHPLNLRTPVGAMIETPAAAVFIERLVKEVDFFSIGTNDLIQYLLTADRTNSNVACYYEPLHPTVLQVLRLLANTAKVTHKNISICGEMAGNPAYTQLLLGLGFRSLSVRPGELLGVKNAIRSTSMQEASELAKRAIELDTCQEIRECIRIAQRPVAATTNQI